MNVSKRAWGCTYLKKWKLREEVMKVRKGLQYNSSGYYDSTAFQAIRDIIAKDKAVRIKKNKSKKYEKSNLEKGRSENGIKG